LAAVGFGGICEVLVHGIHDVFIHAVGAGGFCLVTVNVFSEYIAKERACFSKALTGSHVYDIIVMNETITIIGDVNWFHGCFLGSVPCAGTVPVSDLANSAEFVVE
jgi:hypothetical protein